MTGAAGSASSDRTMTRFRSIAPRDRSSTWRMMWFRSSSCSSRLLLVEQRADPGDDVAGAMPVGDDAGGRLARVVEHRRLARQRAQAGAAVSGDRRERLVDLVRDRGGELRHRGEAQGALPAPLPPRVAPARCGRVPFAPPRARPFRPAARRWRCTRSAVRCCTVASSVYCVRRRCELQARHISAKNTKAMKDGRSAAVMFRSKRAGVQKSAAASDDRTNARMPGPRPSQAPATTAA